MPQVAPEELEVDWVFLEHFSVVRNCIVHANGNKGRLAESKTLDKIVAAYPTELSYTHGVKLVVSDAFVTRCIQTTEQASLAVIRFMGAQSNIGLQPTAPPRP